MENKVKYILTFYSNRVLTVSENLDGEAKITRFEDVDGDRIVSDIMSGVNAPGMNAPEPGHPTSPGAHRAWDRRARRGKELLSALPSK